jgi:hypothetical protein
MDWSLKNPQVKFGLITIAAIFLIYLGLATWADKIHYAEKRVYRAWGIFSESCQHRIQLVPSFTQLIQFYAPQAKGIAQDLNKAYTGISSTAVSEQILTEPAVEQQFYDAHKALEASFAHMEKGASAYPALAQNHQYFMLKQQLVESHEQMLFACNTLNTQIDAYNQFVVGFPGELLNTVFFRNKPMLRCRLGEIKPN